MKSALSVLAGVVMWGTLQAAQPYAAGPGNAPGGPYYANPMMGAQVSEPAMALRAGIDKLLGFLASDQAASAQDLGAFLEAEIAPFFDFEYMAKSAGGRLFEEVDAAVQQGMIAEIKRSFLGKMAEKLSAYDKQQVRFMPPRAGQDGRTAQVSVAILNPGSYPGRLDFRLYRERDLWRVYDVAANGQSAIVHYRNQLMRDLQAQRMQQMRQMRQMPRAMGAMPAPMGGMPMGQPGFGVGPSR